MPRRPVDKPTLGNCPPPNGCRTSTIDNLGFPNKAFSGTEGPPVGLKGTFDNTQIGFSSILQCAGAMINATLDIALV